MLKRIFFIVLSLLLVVFSVYSTKSTDDTHVEEDDTKTQNRIKVLYFQEGALMYSQFVTMDDLGSILSDPPKIEEPTEDPTEEPTEEPPQDIEPTPLVPEKTYPNNAVTREKLESLEHSIKNIELIFQFPDFPTGCESVSAVSVLRYMGFDITVDGFVDKYLKKSSAFYTKDGVLHGPDPTKYFVGDPRLENSFGCFAPVIVDATKKIVGDEFEVLNESGKTLSELADEYISNGVPVITWIPSQMVKIVYKRSWIINGETEFSWPTNEHCTVFVGYDDYYYYFNDPYYECTLRFEKTLSEKRFEELGMQSVVVKKIDTVLEENTAEDLTFEKNLENSPII